MPLCIQVFAIESTVRTARLCNFVLMVVRNCRSWTTTAGYRNGYYDDEFIGWTFNVPTWTTWTPWRFPRRFTYLDIFQRTKSNGLRFAESISTRAPAWSWSRSCLWKLTVFVEFLNFEHHVAVACNVSKTTCQRFEQVQWFQWMNSVARGSFQHLTLHVQRIEVRVHFTNQTLSQRITSKIRRFR